MVRVSASNENAAAEQIPTQRPASNDRIDRGIVMNQWVKSTAMFTLRILIIAVFLYALARIIGAFWAGILPMILALIICTVLAPVSTWLRNHKVPSGFAAMFTMLGFIALLAAIFMLIAPDVVNHSQVLYLQAFEGVQRLQLWLQGPPLNVDPDSINEVVNDISGWIQNQAGAIAGGVFSGISSAAGLSVTLMVIIVLTFFFLKDGHRFLPWLRSATGGRSGLHATELLTRAWNTLSGFIRAQAIVSLIDALFIGIGIWIVGVPMAFTLSVITFLAGFIPIVGAVVAGALAVLIALVSLGFTKALIVLAIVIAVQQLEGNILSPMLQSRAMDLHPVIVLISVTVGGGLFGLVGAFLAVPVAAMVAVTYRYMLDMLRIHSGERTADELDFFTPEGLAIAQIEQEESVHTRRQWREEREWSTAPVMDEVVDAPQPGHGSTSWQKLRDRSNELRKAGGKRIADTFEKTVKNNKLD
ncbi:AI-2E family transporter [Corynebacterium sp. Q4381]|uniref:AI-2E family transporter n=1 Tax=Corynebacterium sp. Marseille-Q4381 TaxID=3121597 RepID=UPI002FE5EA33